MVNNMNFICSIDGVNYYARMRFPKGGKMKPSTFIKAAEMIANRLTNFACCALSQAKKEETGYYSPSIPERNFIEKSLTSTHEEEFWYGNVNNSENQLARSLGLLLCAEILKDKQRSKK